MKKYKEKGITLIALVITIIVLLILAAVSISTLTGQNGILSRADEAVNETGRKTAEEKVAVEVQGSYGEDGNLDYALLEDNLNNIEGIQGVPSPITEGDFPLSVIVDGYKVTIKKDGKVEIDNSQSGEETTPKTVEDLKAGEKVYYDTGNVNVGKNGIIECIVLYDETYNKEKGTNYGIQIISQDIVDTVKLGNGVEGDKYGNETYFNVAKNSYNNALKTLYDKAQEYLNKTYATSSRCVGSKPDDPDWDTNEMFKADSSYTYMTNYNNIFKIADLNYQIDVEQMSSDNLNIVNTGKDYWLGSHDINLHEDRCYFIIEAVNAEGTVHDNPLCTVFSTGKLDSKNHSFGFRPVFTLKPEIKITNGNGIETPYTLAL